MRTPAETHGRPRVLHTHRRREGLLAEAARANDNVANLREVTLRIGAKNLCASVAAEVVVSAVMAKPSRLFSADLQPNKGAAACRTEDGLHTSLSSVATKIYRPA